MASVPFCCLLWLILNCCHISSHLEVNGIYSNSFDQVPPLPPPMFAQVCPWQNKVSGNKFVSTPKFKAEIHATPMFILRHCKPKSFWSILLLLSGDVKINPGPVTFPCGDCGRAVASNHRGICCDTCNKWFHIRCANITPQEYSALCHSIEDWYCKNCISDNDRRQRQLSIRRKRYHEQTDEEWEYQLEARRQRYSEQTDEERQQQLGARRQRYSEQTDEERQQRLGARRQQYSEQTNEERQQQLGARRQQYSEQTDEERQQILGARRQRYSEQTNEERQQQLGARRQQYQEGTGSQISSHDDYLHNGGWKLQSLHEQSWANECMKAFHRKQNQWQHRKVGLCNGATGIVESILYAEGHKPPALPIAVMVNFNEYTGPPFIPSKPKCIPIPPVTFEWQNGSYRLSRQQLPLRLSYAITIHKSQGQTLSKQ